MMKHRLPKGDYMMPNYDEIKETQGQVVPEVLSGHDRAFLIATSEDIEFLRKEAMEWYTRTQQGLELVIAARNIICYQQEERNKYYKRRSMFSWNWGKEKK